MSRAGLEWCPSVDPISLWSNRWRVPLSRFAVDRNERRCRGKHVVCDGLPVVEAIGAALRGKAVVIPWGVVVHHARVCLKAISSGVDAVEVGIGLEWVRAARNFDAILEPVAIRISDGRVRPAVFR